MPAQAANDLELAAVYDRDVVAKALKQANSMAKIQKEFSAIQHTPQNVFQLFRIFVFGFLSFRQGYASRNMKAPPGLKSPQQGSRRLFYSVDYNFTMP
jgi:hypothetical protein